MNHHVGEHPTESLASILPDFPTEGIAYRGDPIQYADDSLQRTSGNYIVFTPDSDSSTEELAVELQEGINFALQFSYPEQWGENPDNSISGQFEGYAAHYSKNPQDLPAISWGTASRIGQFAAIQAADKVFYTRNARITTASVAADGPIDPRNVRHPILATLKDICQIESSIDVPKCYDRKFPWIVRGHRPSAHAEYLGGAGRAEFHSRLGSIMAAKLLSAIKNETQM